VFASSEVGSTVFEGQSHLSQMEEDSESPNIVSGETTVDVQMFFCDFREHHFIFSDVRGVYPTSRGDNW
jgi:hypothetical protein